MRKNVKYSLFIITGFFIATLLYVLWPFWAMKDDSRHFVNTKAEANEWMKSFLELEHIWKNGPDEKNMAELKQNCREIWGDLTQVDRSYLRCNPDVLNCLGREKKEFEGTKATLIPREKDKYYRVFKNHKGALSYEVSLAANKMTQSIYLSLSSDCRRVYLPPRLYALGPAPSAGQKENLFWDNKNRQIFIDRNLVSVRDLKDFLVLISDVEYKDLLSTEEKKVIGDIVEKKNAATPVLEFPMTLQYKYCAVMGGQLLSAEVYDAATFIPFDLNEKFPQHISRAPYPWSKRKTGVFLNEKESTPSSDDCARAYVYECRGKHLMINFEALSNSWIGMRNILGHEMESLRNAISPRKNVALSSKYFSKDSSWHQLGLRGFWNGEGRDYRNFNFGLSDPVSEFKDSFDIGFRCMYQEKSL